MRLAPLLLLLACCLASTARGQHILNPKTYASESGQYELFVDPTEREGVGPALVTMSSNGNQLWQRELPFTPWHAHVTDDGRTIGYTYIHGRQGMTLVYDRTVPNTVDVFFLDAKGDVTRRHAIERQHPSVMSNPPSPFEPMINVLVPIPAHDRVIVKLMHPWDKSPEDWLMYSYTNGEHLKTIDNPSVPGYKTAYGSVRIFNLKPIGDMPLVARHAYIATYQDGGIQTDSAHVSVLDLDGNQVWETSIHNEYRDLERGWWWDNAHDHTSQLQTTADGFTFHSWSKGSRIRFACSKQGDTWTITETGRNPAPFVKKTETAAKLDTIALELAGAIDLGRPPPTLFEHFSRFDFDAQGNIGMATWGEGRGAVFLLFDTNGRVLHRGDLQAAGIGEKSPLPSAAWAGSAEHPARWLLYRDGLGDARPAVWWYDHADGTLTALGDLGMSRIEAMAPLPDGGLLAMGEGRTRTRDGLVAFDAAGEVRWSQPLFSPNDVTVTTQGKAAVVDVIRHEVQFFNLADGAPAGVIDLDAAFGRRANYPTALRPDADGGVIVEDFNGNPPIYRLAEDGSVRAKFRPAFADDRTFDIRGAVVRAADGTLWTSDGSAMFQLDDNGVVQRVVGEKPDDRPLRQIRAMAIGPDGRIYAVNEHNAAIHVFDPAGKPLRILPFGQHTPGVNSGPGAITIGHDGTIYGMPTYQGSGVRYDPAGKPQPPLDGATHQIAEHWAMQPASPVGWSIGYEYAALFEVKGNTTRIVRPIHRRPDNTWIERGNEAAVARNGSLALIASEDRGYARGTPMLCVYAPDGEPQRLYPMPGQTASSQIAFVWPYVVIVDCMPDPHSALLYDVRTDALPRRIEFPAELSFQEHWWYVHPSPTPGEFLMRTSEGLTLHRVRLPSEPEPHK